MALEEAVQQNGIDVSPPPVGAVIAEEIGVKTPEPNWETADDADLKAVWSKNNPERALDGKFASRETKPDTVEKPATELTDQAQNEKPEQQVAAIHPPQSWSAEMKEVFPTLPPAAQEFIAKRESEAQAKITQQGQELSAYEPIGTVLEQHRDIFESNGLSFDDGLARMLNAERMLEQNAPAAIKMLADAYGVDLGIYSGQQQPQDSAAQALHQRIAQLEGMLNQTSSRIEQREKAEAQEREKSTLTTIEKFAQGKTDWAELENDIHAEIIGIKAAISSGVRPAMQPEQILQTAYERAQRNNPDAWAKKMAADKKTEDDKRIAEAKKNAEDASRSKKVNIASGPAGSRTASTSMEDTLRETYRRSNSG